MSAALIAVPPRTSRVTIKPAPRREPPFDDELPEAAPAYGPHDRRLPFDVTPLRPVWTPGPPRPRDLPAPGPWARRLLIGLVETAGGRRPLRQLAPLLSPSVARGLGTDFERARQSGAPHWLYRAGVRSVRVCEPTRGVAELCATLDTGCRVRAIAMRLEEHHGRWCCTRLQLG
jgi:hypothetical protein